jgi:hypothetical protein
VSTNQPNERPVKKILVTVKDYRTVTVRWTLATAVKVGLKYRVSRETINMLTDDAPYGATFTTG